MRNLVPLAGPRWIMTNGYIQSRLLGPPLQLHFPEPKAIAIAAPAVGTNQDPLRLGVEWAPHLSPPTAKALHGKTGCVMRTTPGFTHHFFQEFEPTLSINSRCPNQ